MLETWQPANLWRDLAVDSIVFKVDHSQEGEVSYVRRQGTEQSVAMQVQIYDTPVPASTSDPRPFAKLGWLVPLPQQLAGMSS